MNVNILLSRKVITTSTYSRHCAFPFVVIYDSLMHNYEINKKFSYEITMFSTKYYNLKYAHIKSENAPINPLTTSLPFVLYVVNVY